MMTTEKSQQVKQIANESQLLLSKAELLIQNVIARNTTLAQEIQQTKSELAEKIAQDQA